MAARQAGGLRGTGTEQPEGRTTLSGCRHCSGSARGMAMAGWGCPSGNMHRAQSPVLSVCHIPLAPDSQTDFFKEGSDLGRASATTTNSRQAASSEHPERWGIGSVPLHRHLLQGEDCLMPTTTACQVGYQAGNQGEGLPFRHSTPLCFPLLPPVPALQTLLVCFWSLSPPQPPTLRASCLCSKPSIPAQEQSQSAYRCARCEPAKGTQLRGWLLSPPSLVQALLHTRQSHSYFLGLTSMTNPT